MPLPQRPPATGSLEALRRAHRGAIALPEDDGYDEQRAPWNLAVEQRPAAVAHPRDVDDLRALLVAARDTGATVAVQPCGHGATAALDGAILTRMAAFDRLEVDARARTATIGAGVPWARVIEALDGTGLVVPSGSSRVVTAAGYLLGGGHSLLSRSTGLGAQSLRAAWILRPDGTHERVDDASDPDTMWAMRGAGGVVGIVTALELDLRPAPGLVGGSMVFAEADGPAVLRAVRDEAVDAPRGLNVAVSSMRVPDAPMVPEAVRGKRFMSVDVIAMDASDLGALDALRAAATPVQERVGPTSQVVLAAASMEPEEPSPSRGTATALDGLDDATIDALLTWRALPEQAPLLGIAIRMLGGALDAPSRPAFASLEGAAWLTMGLAPLLPGVPAEPGDASLAGLDALLRPAASTRLVPTFLSPGATLDACASPADLARLRAIRDAADPHGVLHEWRLPR
ncbi:FAD-binding oxidoreductase [Agrococcus sp. BE272]|uniref:FAD-binding oxidoreductase n=1 Tax=Agrococcus sp. BE272 TaxID=2817727 RepID=UPI002854E8F6|nr:FAD-binding oxidoreductase [Agrococcus sp. BE272]MDR7234363.1 FAD/FMN-containing dehydrogenase [Agrococcus sp. BE272]